jgi:hypothetical protein
MCVLIAIFENCCKEFTPQWRRSEKQLKQPVHSALFTSGDQGGSWYSYQRWILSAIFVARVTYGEALRSV